MSYVIITDSGELYHHGVKGQQWGVQNGPPYPLNQNIKSESKTGFKIKRKTAQDKIKEKAKTKTGEEGAEIGRKVAETHFFMRKLKNTHNDMKAWHMVAKMAERNPGAAAMTTAAMWGAEYVDYKLSSMMGTYAGRVAGDAIGTSRSSQKTKKK